MHPIEQLKLMEKTSYVDSEGDIRRIKLKSGLTNKEIQKLKNSIPSGRLNKELEELLKFTRGFKPPGGFLDEIYFDNFSDIHFKSLFSHHVTFVGDGIGGYWIQEINQKGELGQIYLLGHDPAVLIKQAENLTEFLIQIDEYFKEVEESFFSKIYNNIASDIYFGKGKLLEQGEAINSTDKLIADFASNYNEDWFIADLRNAKNGEGFRLEAGYDETIRLGHELIWALKKYKYVSFWTRLKEWLK